MPFGCRLENVRDKLASADQNAADLALGALNGALETSFLMRPMGPPTVAGRLPPEDWQPRTKAEALETWRGALDLLLATASGDGPPSRKALAYVFERVNLLLWEGFLDELRDFFDGQPLGDVARAELLEAVEGFLDSQVRSAGANPGDLKSALPEDYLAKVREWRDALAPRTLHERVVRAVNSAPRSAGVVEGEEAWKSELEGVANELCGDPAALGAELEFLSSPQAGSPSALAFYVGRGDAEGRFLGDVLATAEASRSGSFARGYLRGLMSRTEAFDAHINGLLDTLEPTAPRLAHELYMAGGERTRAVERSLRLVDEKQLPVAYLQGFSYNRPLKTEDIVEILGRYVAEFDDEEVRKLALDFAAYRLARTPEGARLLGGSHELQALVWRLFEETAGRYRESSYWWAELLKTVWVLDPERASDIAVAALLERGLMGSDHVSATLLELAQKHPRAFMSSLGRAALKPELGWKFHVGNYKELMGVIPTDVITGWVKDNGVEAARALARSLPNPYLSPEGAHVVPELTAFVLGKYGHDDRVFDEFVAGVHSLQMYSGDIAAQRRREAEVARGFLDHPLPRVREWAALEIESSTKNAERWQQREEEHRFGR